MKIPNSLHVEHRSQWRKWLARNHASQKEIWLVFHKVHTGKPRLKYEDAVEEALCFGWIDSIVQRINDESYAQKFTPRNAGSTWSEPNRKRVQKLMKEGKMTEAGLAAAKEMLEGKAKAPPAGEAPSSLSPELEKMFKANGAAWRSFERTPPSYQKMAIGWVMSAQKEETQIKRLEELIRMSALGKRIGLK
ncbi:YdeI/OmpD-associated family protein [bacterium]|nr:YdeI/OmpD-associated family protein [bacterium]MBU1984741.1 YdeI/OmpD-associated family protein [bacterium]